MIVKSMKARYTVALFFIFMSLFVPIETRANVEEPAPVSVQLRILETTDLHGNVLSYDYEKNTPTIEYGLDRTSTLIKEARREVPNSLLFDNGDLIKGNKMAQYIAEVRGLGLGEIHPVYQAMNIMGYDAATLGNHEFNYGIEYLQHALQGARFPYVNANIYVDDHNNIEFDDINVFNPYKILNKTVVDTRGKKHKLKVGVLGIITPVTMHWDKDKLLGKIKIKDMAKTAEQFVPIMKQKGADIIIVLAHAGLDRAVSARNKVANTIYPLSKVDGINAILFGHAHTIFPDKSQTVTVDGIDFEKGTINGVPAVQAGYWGNHLGIIDFQLEKANGEWKVINSQSQVRPIYEKKDGRKVPLVEPDQDIIKSVIETHKEVLQYK